MILILYKRQHKKSKKKKKEKKNQQNLKKELKYYSNPYSYEKSVFHSDSKVEKGPIHNEKN